MILDGGTGSEGANSQNNNGPAANINLKINLNKSTTNK
jgi:hypothetical protein